ncbi:transposase, MuDR, MULE transposase domain protein [Tanacetum coccineum]
MANEPNDVNNQDDHWELSLDIDDSDLRLTPALPKLFKENVFILGSDGALMSTQEYMQKVVEDVGEDDDFKSGPWFSSTNYVNTNGGTITGCLGDIKNFLKNRKLDQVVAIVKSCSPNAIGDLTVTMKDLTCTIPGTIHYKVIGEGGYGKDITVGTALILANVLVFSPKPSMHYLNITMRTSLRFSVKIRFLKLCLRMKYRLSLKNDMPLRDKISLH